MTGIRFRLLQKGDESAAAEIERSALDTAWNEAQISEVHSNENAVYALAVCGDSVCGIGSMYCVAGEGQIMNIAVDDNYRKKGIAYGLMEYLANIAAEKNCENITLEVAENNIPAISLYKKCGYTIIAKRKGFYKGIDAFIMEKVLTR